MPVNQSVNDALERRGGTGDVQNEVDVRLGHAEEEAELEHSGERACAPGLDRQADKAANHELAALERLGLLLDVVQLENKGHEGVSVNASAGGRGCGLSCGRGREDVPDTPWKS